MNRDEAKILARTAQNFAMVERGLKADTCFSTELPMIVGIKLTNKCNLRCKTCYEWNEKGYHHLMSKEQQCKELDIELFEKIIRETQSVKSSLYLWGGEPLTHSNFSQISYIMEKEKRISAVCTNGTLIEEHMDDIVRFSYLQELLIALDGLEEGNDFIRGKGTFSKVVSNIQMLLKLRKKGLYKGKISIHCVLTDVMINRMYEFLEYLEQLGIDSVVICYPWYLSEATSASKNLFYEEKFGEKAGQNASWNAFKFSFPKDKVQDLFCVRDKILQRKWKMKVKFQPNLASNNIKDFIMDEEKRESEYCCYSVADRMEVLPDGSISSCKHFPEFVIGNLREASVKEIWKSSRYDYVRQTIQCGLMPACTKCNNLYLHGRKRRGEG